jgi:hypothetical protein
MSESMLHVKHTITRHRTPTHYWSISTAHAIQAECYWKLRLRHLTILSVIEGALQYHRVSAGLPPEVEDPATHQQLVENLHSTTEHIKAYKKDHVGLQVSY